MAPMSSHIDRTRSGLSYDTLSDCWASHVDVMAICEVEAHRCYRSATLDLVALIVRHGDLTIDQLRRRLVCQVCGRRSYRLQVLHQPGPVGSRPPRELPAELRKKLVTDAVGRGMAAVADARAEIRDGKPMRLSSGFHPG